jgi:hypothetical protein
LHKNLEKHHPHPSLPPPRGRVRVGGQKSPKVRFSCHLEKEFLAPELKDTKNISEKIFATIRVREMVWKDPFPAP